MKLRNLLCVALFVPFAAAQAVSIEWTAVGDPGNPAHPVFPGGSISYAFEAAKYEVTNEQWVAFLNSVAQTDTFGLFNSQMTTNASVGGILRSGVSGSYIYTAKPGFEQRLVSYVSYWDACRFTNWLHNGQPSGMQGVGTTETGAYTLTPSDVANNTVVRNADARFALPTREEFWKAGYYDPNTQTWFTSPAGSSMQMVAGDPTADNGNMGNCEAAASTLTTAVGAYSLSVSPNGTYDQGGNVREWVNRPTLLDQEVHGGSFASSAGGTSITSGNLRRTATIEESNTGIRLLRLNGGAVQYCAAGLTTSGCLASIRGAGVPSASASVGFTIEATNVEGQKQGLIFYGVDNSAWSPTPWAPSSSSFLCVKPPTQRTAVHNTGGANGQCDGVLSIDWNAFMAANAGALGQPLSVGQHVYAQAWFRDPPAPKTTNLSGGLKFVVQP